MEDRLPLRLGAEFVVIVLGVFLALAADRWNQGRSDAAAEAAYVTRLTNDIRSDSVRAEEYLARVPAIGAARDTLVGVLDGSSSPENLRATIFRAMGGWTMLPASTWSELLASSSLNLLADPEVREAVSTYYGDVRERNALNARQAGDRAYDPFLNQVYLLGILDIEASEDGDYPDNTAEALAAGGSPEDLTAFRDAPGMRGLINSLNTMQFFQVLVAKTTIRETGTVLRALDRWER